MGAFLRPSRRAAHRLAADRELRKPTRLDLIPRRLMIDLKTDPPAVYRPPQFVLGHETASPLLSVEQGRFDHPADRDRRPTVVVGVHHAMRPAVQPELVHGLLQLIDRNDVVLLVHDRLTVDGRYAGPAEHLALIRLALGDLERPPLANRAARPARTLRV